MFLALIIAYFVIVWSVCIALRDIIPQVNRVFFVLQIAYIAQNLIAVIFVMRVSIP